MASGGVRQGQEPGMGGEVISDTTIGLRAVEFHMHARRTARNCQACVCRSSPITLASPYRPNDPLYRVSFSPLIRP
jgi:hypothetical protein